VQESLDAIGEALNENGKVIVTGCLGAKGDIVRETYPNLLAVTGPHARRRVMEAVHKHLPKPHDPFTDLVPPAGIKLTPRHYAYLKISEGCNHRCTVLHHPVDARRPREPSGGRRDEGSGGAR
jgi:ribosomal protein S12 methylthiotransferase